MPEPEVPKVGTPEWSELVRRADPATRAELLKAEAKWRESKGQIDSGALGAFVGLLILVGLAYASQSWAVGAAVGGPIIAGGVLYMMKA